MSALRWLNQNFEKALIVCITSLMLIVLLLQVFSRYALNSSISWAEEVAIFGVIWLTYFGASLAIVQRRHIRILLFAPMLSPIKNKMMDILVNIIFFIFLIIVTYGTIKMATHSFDIHQTAAASGMPVGVVIAGIPVAFLCSCFRLFQDTMILVKEYKLLKSGGEIDRFNTAIKTEKDGD